MMIFVKSIGILITFMGTMILLNPKIARKMMGFWRQGKHMYIGGLVRLMLGIIFLYYAPAARAPQLLSGLGVLALAGGLLIFIVGIKKIKAILDWWDKKPESFLRLLSLFVIVFGVLIIYAA
ncbi:MAG: hypothetical protein WC695_11495 [Candidatus Omnitrophota bacterium]